MEPRDLPKNTNRRRWRQDRPSSRCGLSTLEMVLALPLLLFMMALMLNYGTVACWKVRALSVARHSVWASRAPRSAAVSPRPAYWPSTGTGNGFASLGNVPGLDDSRVDLPIARGPLPYGTGVNSDLLNPQRGLLEGSASLTRGFPLMGSLGNYDLQAHNYLLDDTWEFQRMVWGAQNAWLPSNQSRRIPVIYALAKADSSLSTAFSQAVMASLRAAYRRSLRPLDDDEELEYYLTTYLGYPAGTGVPNFATRYRVPSVCSMDAAAIQALVDNLVNRIQGTPDANGRLIGGMPADITRGYIRAYNRIIRALQNLLNADPPPADPAGIQAAIASLQAEVDALQQLLQTLQ